MQAPADRQDEPLPATPEAAPPPVPTVADLLRRCGELRHPGDDGYPNANDASEDCQRALQARFAQAHSAAGLFPLSRPMVWSDVFDDAAAGFEAVLAALRDPACEVAAHDLRVDLAQRCAARETAELAVLGDVCGTQLHEFDSLDQRAGIDPERYLTTLGAGARLSATSTPSTAGRENSWGEIAKSAASKPPHRHRKRSITLSKWR